MSSDRSKLINDVPIITHLKTQDCDEMAQFAQGWNEDYIQLKKGKFALEMCVIEVGGWQFIEQSCTGSILYRGSSPTGTFGIAIPTLHIEEMLYGGNQLSEGCYLTGNSAGYLDVRTMNKSRILIITGPIEQLLARSDKMQRSLTREQLSSPGIIVPHLMALKQLSDYVEQVLVLAKTYPERLRDSLEGYSMTHLIIEDSLPLLVDVLTSKCDFLPEKESKRRKLVKRTEELMQNNLTNPYPLTLTDLCQGLDASQRTLYYAFEECFGLTPMEYLKILRLHEVRRALKKADPQTDTVTETATKFGFWHMGQFSTDYKQMFGELPSIALKQKNFSS